MGSADVDLCEAHVTVRNALTRQLYVTTDGLTSSDINYADCSGVESMYEPTKSELSTARVTLPSLIAMPELRTLHQQFKEGDRVEIYDFQPDCGDPVFAGFIPPGGITEEGGQTILDVLSPLALLQWRRLRRYEFLNENAAGHYLRCLQVWTDLVADDFSKAGYASDYTLSTGGSPILTTAQGYLQLKTTAATNSNIWYVPTYLASGFKVFPGDAYLLECDATLFSGFAAGSFVQASLLLENAAVGQGSNPRVGSYLQLTPSGVGAFPQQQSTDIEIYPTGGLAAYDPASHGTNQVLIPVPAVHRYQTYIRFSDVGATPTVTVSVFVDGINVAYVTLPWTFDGQLYVPLVYMQVNQIATDYAQVTNWRVRKLLPILNKAGRFNPQTADILPYQPNNEDQLQFLQLIALKDNAEYRVNYRAWPRTDEVELDGVGLLGRNVSALFGYDQPGSPPASAVPQLVPFDVPADFGSFAIAPPFRFEEGSNLAAVPKVNTPSNLHANDILQMGASTAEAQTFYEAWNPSETGRPQHSPTGALYPYFEQVVNDDRVGLQSLAKVLAQYELARRTDTTPSLTLQVVEELPFANKWRAGDTVYVVTRSLRTNVEQNLRIFTRRWQAGSPVKEVTVGRGVFDPEMTRLRMEAMVQGWLYDQSGTSPYTYTIANSTGSTLLAGSSSPDSGIPLDQYTAGTQLVAAYLHWYADANVMNLQPFINGLGVYVTGLVGASNTDSGLINVTQYLQQPGQYQVHFKNNDANTRTISIAVLELRIRA